MNVTRRRALMLLSAAGVQVLGAHVARADIDGLEGVKAKLAEAEAGLGVIADDYEALCKRQSDTLDALHDVNLHIAKIQSNVEGIAERLTNKQKALSLNVSDEYKVGNRGIVDVLLGSTSIEEFIEGLYYFNKVSEDQVRLIQDVKDERASLEDERDRLSKKRDELERVSRTQAEQLDAMRDKQYEAEVLVAGLDDEVLGLVNEREEGLLAAQQEAAKARRERAKARDEARNATTSAAIASGSWKNLVAVAMGTSAGETPRGLSATRRPSSFDLRMASAVSYEYEDDYGYEDEYESLANDDWSGETEPEDDLWAEPEGEQGVVLEEAPQEQFISVGSAAAVIAACKSTPSPGGGLCAAWCSNVLMNAGFDFVSGNANDMYAEYCYSTDLGELRPGMAVAVSTHPHTTAGRIYGHIGMYVGDGLVMDNVGYVRTISLEEWMSYYGETVPVRWGWLGGYVLA